MPTSAKTKRKTTKKAATASPSAKTPARSKKSTGAKATKKKPTKKTSAKSTKNVPTTDSAAPASETKPAAKKSSRTGKTKMASTTTKKTTTKKTSKKAAAPKPTKKKTSTTKDTTKKAPTKKAPAKSSKSAPKSSKSTSAKTSTKSAKEPKAKPEPKKPAAPRFRTFFSSADDGAAAAKKLAAAAGLTKLKDEGKRIAAAPAEKRLTKSPLSKKERDHYKEILLLKRAQLVGDVTNMETEALTGGGSGSLSSLPQHMADAGSDTYDQSLNLDLAAGQRKLLREIDDALGRIADNTFGICEYLGVQINAERLENTPWARYSIEGAREMEHLGLL